MLNLVAQKIQGIKSFYGGKGLLRIGLNAFLPNKASLNVAFIKANYNDYYYLKKHYGNKIKAEYAQEDNYRGGLKRIIWTLWLQGENDAPEIVKACWNSIRRHIPEGYSLVILDKDSIKNYVRLPEFIERRYENGEMKMAHYSDLARLKLLLEYGGYWIDSTVYCTNSLLFNYIDEKCPSLFVYKNILRNDDASALSNWLIFSNPNNAILKNVYNILIDYWKAHKEARNYFLFHIIFKIVTEKIPDEWNNIPTMDNVGSHVLQTQLFDEYNEDYFRLLGSTVSFHKLTYRIKETDLQRRNTYYHYIISQGMRRE